MIVKHIRTNELYKTLLDSFSVERQKASKVYVHLKTGAVFDRDADKFNENFVVVNGYEQEDIRPKEPHT